MRNFILGIVIAMIDIVLIIAGITCFIISKTSGIISTQMEALLIIGLIGIGIGAGTLLSVGSILLLANSN